MKINHNIQALNAYRNLSANQLSTSKNLEKLSSGLRINRAADDAAGLAISEKMRSQIRGLAQAERNSLDGISMIQTAEGALGSIHDILQRMRELAVQSSNGTNTDDDRAAIQGEIDQLTQEIDRISDHTQFNNKALLAGDPGGRPFAETDAVGEITYVNNTNTWQGVFNANPSNDAGFNIEIGSSLGDKDALDGTVLEINGKKYELEGKSDGVANGNIFVDVSTIGASAATDSAEVTRLNSLANAIKTAISANDPDLDVSVVSATVGSVSEGDLTPAVLNIRTATPAAPKDLLTGGKYQYLQGLNATGTAASALVFTDLRDTVINPDGINAAAVLADTTSTQPKSIDIMFAEVPKKDDELQLDGFTFVFTDSLPSEDYDLLNPAKTTYNISVKDANLDDVLGQIKKVINAGKLDNNTNLNAISGFDVVGGNVISISTLKTNDGDTTFHQNGSANGLEIRLKDGDFESNAGKSLKLSIQAGANNNESMDMEISVMDAASLGLARDASHQNALSVGNNAAAGIDVSTESSSRTAIDIIDQAIKKVSSERSKLGAYQNRLEHTVSNLTMTNENLTASESRIRDVDMALEMSEFTKNNILNQSAQAMLAQANQFPQGILQLLQ